MRRIEDFKYILDLLQGHRSYFILCLGLTMANALIFGAGLSLVLPVVNMVLFGGGQLQGSGYFTEVTRILESFIPNPEATKVVSLAIFALSLALNAVFAFAVHYMNTDLTQRLTVDCRRALLSSVQEMRFDAFRSNDRGSYVQLLVTEVRSVYSVIKQSLQLLQSGFNISVCLILMIVISYRLTGLLFAGLIIIAVSNGILGRIIGRMAQVALTCRLKLNERATEVIFGLKQTRLFGAESRIGDSLDQISQRNEKQVRLLQILNALQPMFTQILGSIVFLVIVSVALYFPVFTTDLPPQAGVVTFLVVLGRLATPLSSMANTYGALITSLPGVRKISEFLKRREAESTGSLRPEDFLTREMVAEGVAFSYGPDTRDVLSGLDFRIRPGEYIGLMGPSGAGKSTFLNLLPRLTDPTQGNIQLDGRDLRELDLRWLRSHISILPQDFFLFNTSLRENMLLARPEATDEEIRIALEKAGMGDYLAVEGLDAEVGANGENLSGGQRQRVGLAAIFLRDSHLILLDEGLSSVDADTERFILESLRELNARGKTIISSAHKLSTLKDAGAVYELRDGMFEPYRE